MLDPSGLQSLSCNASASPELSRRFLSTPRLVNHCSLMQKLLLEAHVFYFMQALSILQTVLGLYGAVANRAGTA